MSRHRADTPVAHGTTAEWLTDPYLPISAAKMTDFNGNPTVRMWHRHHGLIKATEFYNQDAS